MAHKPARRGPSRRPGQYKAQDSCAVAHPAGPYGELRPLAGRRSSPIISRRLQFAPPVCPVLAIAHRLDLHCLRFEACSESLDFLLLLREGRFQLLHLAVLFEELVQQHRVHRLIAHGDNLPW
jgi:hypothetical protein